MVRSMMENDKVCAVPAETVPFAWHMPRAIVFLAIVEQGSISGAARAMNLSKSVVSTHLRQLEEMCGARLIERTTRKLRLTGAGVRLLPYARRLASAWTDGLEEVTATMQEPTGTLTVTTTTLAEHSLVAPAVAAFVERYPRATVDVHSTDQIVDLIAQNVDLAVRTGPLPDSSLVARKLGEDVDLVVASPGLAARLREVDRPEELHTLPWVLHRRMPAPRELFGPEGRRFELEVTARARVDSAPALLGLAVRGAGVALVPGLVARDALRSGQLVRVLPNWHGATFGLYAVFPSRRHLAPKVDRFIAELERELR